MPLLLKRPSFSSRTSWSGLGCFIPQINSGAHPSLSKAIGVSLLPTSAWPELEQGQAQAVLGSVAAYLDGVVGRSNL